MSLDQMVPGAVRTVRLAARGADALWEALTAVGSGLTGDVRVVVVRGDGADFFYDSTGAGAPPPPGAISWLRRPDLITVAAMAGRTTGAGLDVALACDLRFAADDAQLAVAGHADGLAAEPARETLARLGDLVGAARALELALTGRAVSGLEAAAIGLVNQATPRDRLDHAVAAAVAALVGRSHASTTEIKALLTAPDAARRGNSDELIAGITLAAMET